MKIKQFDQNAKDKIKSLIIDLCKDEDNDVKYYAQKFLENL